MDEEVGKSIKAGWWMRSCGSEFPTVGTHPDHVVGLHSPAGADKTVCKVSGKGARITNTEKLPNKSQSLYMEK